MKSQFRTEILPYPVEKSDAVCKSNVDGVLNDPNITRNNAHVDFFD